MADTGGNFLDRRFDGLGGLLCVVVGVRNGGEEGENWREDNGYGVVDHVSLEED